MEDSPNLSFSDPLGNEPDLFLNDPSFALSLDSHSTLTERTGLVSTSSDDGDNYVDEKPVSFLNHPLSIKIILMNELCERFSYYGYRAILSLYLVSRNFSDDGAISIYAYTSAFSSVTPLFGGYISDAFLGRYKTILIFSIIYLIGSIVLTLGAWDVTNPEQETWFIFLALFLTSVGYGGIKPNVSTFGADQLDTLPDGSPRNGYNSSGGVNSSSAKATQSFFYLFYFIINVGSVLSTIFIPIIRTRVNYAAAFGVPAILLALSIIILLFGNLLNQFHHVPPNKYGSAMVRVWKMLYLTCKRRKINKYKYQNEEGQLVSVDEFLNLFYQQHLPELATNDSLINSSLGTVNKGGLSCMGCRNSTSTGPKSCCSSPGGCNCGCQCNLAIDIPTSSSSSSSYSLNDQLTGDDVSLSAQSTVFETEKLRQRRLASFLPFLDRAMMFYAPLDSLNEYVLNNPDRPVSLKDVKFDSHSFFSYVDSLKAHKKMDVTPHVAPAADSPPVIVNVYQYGFSCSDIADARRLLGVVPMFSTLPIFWCLMNQQGSTWMLQAETMKRSFWGFTVEPEQMSVLNPVFLFIFLPLFEFLFRQIFPSDMETLGGDGEVGVGVGSGGGNRRPPTSAYQNLDDSDLDQSNPNSVTSRWSHLTSPLFKMFIGMLCASIAYVSAALVELYIINSSEKSVTIAYQSGQYFFITLAEVLVSVTGMHLAYESAPKDMKSLVTSLLLLSSAFGDVITAGFYSIFAAIGFSRWMMFIAFAVCSVLNGVYLLVIKAKFEHLYK